MRHVYLDHSSTTPIRKEVLEAMMPYMTQHYGNASSQHSLGQTARKAIDNARDIIANTIGTEHCDIIFTSGGSEANNLAIKGVTIANLEKGRHIITSQIEHLSVLNTCKFLEEEMGFEVTYLKVDKYGIVDLDELKGAIKKGTVLISIMHANNEVGTIEPIKEIAKIAKRSGIYFHTDAVQSFGKLTFNAEELGVDTASFSAHKLYGPKGIGALYVRKGINILPIQHGGHQERGLRSGTEDVAGIVGFGEAVKIAKGQLQKATLHLKNLGNRFYEGVTRELSDIYLNGHPDLRLSGVLNISFKSVEGESLVISLDLKGIYASTGSACAVGSTEPSYVLLSMGVSPELAQSSVRFSFGYENTLEDVEHCLQEIPPIVKRLREVSLK